MTTEVKTAALARLEMRDRACDGCGERIGRWTKKCHYAERWDRVYCSTGGCAARVREAVRCAGSCGDYLNPFFEMTEIPGVGELCTECAAGMGSHEDALSGLRVIDPYDVPEVSASDQEAAAYGPYVVVQSATTPDFYQVIFPLTKTKRTVRSTGNQVRAMVSRCARFNNDFHAFPASP